MPVYELLGGRVRERVRVYGWIGGDDFAGLVAAAQRRKAQGFTAVKMNATGGSYAVVGSSEGWRDTMVLTPRLCVLSADAVAWIDSPAALDIAVRRLQDVRALGLDVGIDFHGRLHKGMARQLAHLLEPHQPLFIEGTSCPRGH